MTVCVHREYRGKSQKLEHDVYGILFPPSFTTVTMVTSSKVMYNANPAPSVNYGYRSTIGCTYLGTNHISYHVIPSFYQETHINDAPLPRKHYKSWEIIVQRVSIETAFIYPAYLQAPAISSNRKCEQTKG